MLRVNAVIGTTGRSTASTQDEKITFNIAAQAQEAASTAVHMLDGDCDAVFSEGFLDTPAYVELHKQTVADVRTIRIDTMALIERGCRDG
jgi:predicted TIM-barrel enzyme